MKMKSNIYDKNRGGKRVGSIKLKNVCMPLKWVNKYRFNVIFHSSISYPRYTNCLQFRTAN